jgi:UDP-glucose 4-epimerase
MEFKRPEPSLYPQIFGTFSVKSKKSDEVEEFYIQDLTENFFNDAVNFIVKNHARGAVFHKAAKTLVNESGVQRVRDAYRNVFKEKISLICLKMGTNEIVGLNALTIKTRENLIKPDVN